jgi:hypothetical protein
MNNNKSNAKGALKADILGKLAKVSDLYQIISELFRFSLERKNDITQIVTIFSNKKKSSLPYKSKHKLLLDIHAKELNRQARENLLIQDLDTTKICDLHTIKYVQKMTKKMADQFPLVKPALHDALPSSVHVAIIMDGKDDIDKKYSEIYRWLSQQLTSMSAHTVIATQYWKDRCINSYYSVSEIIWLVIENSIEALKTVIAQYTSQIEIYSFFHPNEKVLEESAHPSTESHIKEIYSGKTKSNDESDATTDYGIMVKHNEHSMEEISKYNKWKKMHQITPPTNTPADIRNRLCTD